MSRAILWDMDGTLTDSEPAHAAAFDAVIAELGLVVPQELHDGLLGASGKDVFAAVQAATGTSLTQEDWTRIKHGHFARHARAVARRDPAASLAEQLAARGVPMALVTNSTSAEVDICLRATGLANIFGTIVTRGDVAQGKPAPEGYLLAAKRLGVAPSNCLVIEDSSTGARAGIAAGMQVIFHPQTPATPPPDGARYLIPEHSSDALIEAFLNTEDKT